MLYLKQITYKGNIMENTLGLWFGFIGIVVGAVITFITELIIRKTQMRFDVSIEIRETLIKLNESLTSIQSKVLKSDEDFLSNAYGAQIISLKDCHYELMNSYKVYRIHMGDLKAYELDSAIYQYYFDKARQVGGQPLTETEYYHAFQAIRYAVGLLINHTRFELVRINSIKKIKRVDEEYKQNQYLDYAKVIVNWLSDNRDWIEKFAIDKDNKTPFYRASLTVRNRICPFLNELKHFDKNIKPNLNIKCD